MDEAFREALIEGEQAGTRYLLAPPRHVPLGRTGSQLGQHAGASLEFLDHREYQPGDDLRRIDWAAFARSDRLSIKLYREEITPHVDLLLDGSQSMALAESSKARATLALAACFATAARNAHFTHSAWITRGRCRRIFNGHERPSSWRDVRFEDPASPAEAFLRMPPSWPPLGIRVFISDLLWLGDPLELLNPLSHNAASVVVVQVLAAADADPPQQGNVQLVDAETGQTHEIFIDASTQQRYRQALGRHQEAWHRACRQVGARMATVVAERLLEHWNLDELVREEILTLP